MPKRKLPYSGSTPGVIQYNNPSPPSSSQAPRRHDAPEVRNYSRGSRDTAIAIALDPRAREECRREAEQGAYSKNAFKSRECNLALWNDIAVASGFINPALVSPELLFTVSGILKRAGFRSAPTILCVAKLKLIQDGVSWTSQLDRCFTMCNSFLKRGMGPAAGASAFPLHRAPELNNNDFWSINGPLGPRNALAVGLWWLCREIELANIKVSDVNTSQDSAASLSLPASKTDINALGTSRTLKCICVAGCADFSGLNDICPVCSIKAQLVKVRQLAVSLRRDAPGMPLFPDRSGGHVSKSAMIATFRLAASKLGINTAAHHGAQAFGGHSLRVGGIQFLGKAGVELWRIQALARHSSSSTLRYLRDVHADVRPDISRDAAMTASIEEMRRSVASLTADVAALRMSTTSSAAAAIIDLSQADVAPAPQGSPAGAVYVTPKRRNGWIHTMDPSTPGWTLCDWPFCTSSSVNFFPDLESAPQNKTLCPHCMKAQAVPNASDISAQSESESPR